MNSINVSISRQDNPTTSTLTTMNQFLNYFNVTGRHALIIIAVAVSFFIGNGQFDLFDNSETHYTRMIQEIHAYDFTITRSFCGDQFYWASLVAISAYSVRIKVYYSTVLGILSNEFTGVMEATLAMIYKIKYT